MRMRSLLDWQEARAEEAMRKGRIREAVDFYRQPLRIREQARAGDNRRANLLDVIPDRIAVCAYAKLHDLGRLHPGHLSEDESQAIEQGYRDVWLDHKAWTTAFSQASAAPPQSSATWWSLGLAAACWVGLPMFFLLGLVALVAGAASRWLRRGRSISATRFGVVRHLLCWLAGFGLSFLLFGIAPAGIVPPRVQGHANLALALLVGVSLLAWGGWRWLRWRRFQYTLAELFVFLLLVCIVTALITTLWRSSSLPQWIELIEAADIPARGWGGVDVSVLEVWADPQANPWYWALSQWVAYGGRVIGVVAALAMIAGWAARRAGRKQPEASEHRVSAGVRGRSGAALACVARSCAVVAAVCLLLFLAAAPDVMREVHRDYQQNVAFARATENGSEACLAAYEAIRSDPDQVNQLQATIEGYIQQEDANLDRRLAEEDAEAIGNPE
jgi:hypothetical protein